jgi:anti-sigma regulatory factor (Ser/Thr protein kinase)
MILLQTRILNGASAAHEARDVVAGLKTSLPEGLLDDVVLLVSELVTNSHRHAGLSGSSWIELRVERSKGWIRVEVSDEGHAAGAEPHMRQPGGDGGWGLHIVDNLATRWGVESREGRTLVWFEIDLNGDGREQARTPDAR